MSTTNLERTAYTVECFLNSLRLNDGPARTAIEEWLTRWLADGTRKSGDCAIYGKSTIDCYSDNKVVKSFAVPEVTQPRTIWCDGSKLSVIDGEEFLGTGKLVMLGVAGLVLTMPGVAAADAAARRKQNDGDGGGGNSNNNNNNNNNNHNNNG